MQGASTIEQQFIKNALQAQSHRTIFEKLREAALAYQLSHKWSKEKIITAYLNTIYFGNGAYGIEAAAQTYFGQEVNHLGCGTPNHQLCVEQLQPWEAALLAGVIQSPTGYDPATHPVAARARRDVVLRADARAGLPDTAGLRRKRQAGPARAQGHPGPPGADGRRGRRRLLHELGAAAGDRTLRATRAFDGGLRIKTTLDLELQRAAEQADQRLPAYSGGPTASLVAIENSTGEVRAMVGGRNYDESPFNLATEGERQPGSSFKAFDLAAALEDGISPDSVWTSKQKVFIVARTGGHETFVVHNDEGAYTGANTLTGATAFSDNSIYAEVGPEGGHPTIARLAHQMGITTPLSTNPAMTIGGLTVGVTPLDMAHAYETIAHGGRRVSGTLAEDGAPVAIQEVDAGSAHAARRRASRRQPGRDAAGAARPKSPQPRPRCWKRCSSTAPARPPRSASSPPARRAPPRTTATPGSSAGTASTRSPCGSATRTSLVPMTTDFNGGPVLGGTFPALIWHDFMTSALQIDKTRAEHAAIAKAHGHRRRPAPRPRAGSETGAPSSTPSRARPAPAPATGQANGKPAAPRRQPAGASGRGAAQPANTHTAPSAPRPPTPTPSAPSAARQPAGALLRRPRRPAGRHRRPRHGRREPFAASVRPRTRRGCPRRASGRAGGARRGGCRPRRSATGSSTALRDPDARCPRPPAVLRQSPRARADPHRPACEVAAVLRSAMPSAWVSLPGPEQQIASRIGGAPLTALGARRAARAHRLDPRERARAPGSAPPRRRPRARTPRSAARGCRRSGTRRRAPAGPNSVAGARRQARRRRGRPARSRGRPRSRRSPRGAACSTVQPISSRATSSTGRA